MICCIFYSYLALSCSWSLSNLNLSIFTSVLVGKLWLIFFSSAFSLECTGNISGSDEGVSGIAINRYVLKEGLRQLCLLNKLELLLLKLDCPESLDSLLSSSSGV